MQLTFPLSLATLLLFQVSCTLAGPILENDQRSQFLEGRNNPPAKGSSNDDPIAISVDCTGVEEVCEAQCIAKLCFGAPAVLQHKGGEKYSESNRQKSGAKSDLFKKGAPTLTPGVNVEMPPCSQDWTSPEDTTAASSAEGGYGTIIAPVLPKHNTDEGSRFGAELTKNNVDENMWYKKGYTNAGPYCDAFMKGTPSAKEQCTKNVDDQNDLINYMYRRSSKKRGNSLLWQKMTYGMTWVQSNDFPTS